MSKIFLVETSGGAFVRKTREELLPEDMIVFDGPGAFADVEDAQRSLDEEIAEAGGLERWRKLHDSPA